MNFGQAIEEAKRGKKIARKGWNGKGQYVELATNVSYKSPNGTVTNVNHKDMGNKALAFVGTSGVQLGWLASQADMLSEDWQTIVLSNIGTKHLNGCFFSHPKGGNSLLRIRESAGRPPPQPLSCLMSRLRATRL